MPPTPQYPVEVLFGGVHMTAEHYEWFKVDVSVTVVALVVLFFAFKMTYTHGDPSKTTRGLAWFLSTMASSVQSCAGTVYALYFLRSPYAAHDLWTDDRLSRFTLSFFATFLVLDLVLGMFFYRRFVDPLSGWVHHIMYLLLVRVLLQYNASVALMPPFVEEIPTVLLGLGNMFPALRLDLLFGLTFFVTRVVFQTYYAAHLISFYNTHHHPAVFWSCVAASTAVLLHVFWFLSWCRKLPRYLGSKSKRA